MAERTEMTPSADIGGGGDSSGSRGEASAGQHRGAAASAGDNVVAAASHGGEAAAGPTRAASASAAEVGAAGLPPRSKRKPAADAPTKHALASGRSDAAATKPPAGKKPKRGWRDTRTGRVLELLAYLVMLVLVLVYFTGKGLFIYEGF